MTASASRVHVADLYDNPGVSRHLQVPLQPTFIPDMPLISLEQPVHVDVLLESLVDGILVRGTITADVVIACARCLIETNETLTAQVADLFVDTARVDAGDEVEEGYEIIDVRTHPTVDLSICVRDAFVANAPLRPLCRADCQGLCVDCGADRNLTTCACSTATPVNPWSVLSGLSLPADDQDTDNDHEDGQT